MISLIAGAFNANLSSQVGRNTSAVESHSKTLESVSGELTSSTAKIADAEKRLEETGRQLDAAKNDLASLSKKIEASITTLNDHGRQIGSLLDSTSKLTAAVDVFRQQLDQLGDVQHVAADMEKARVATGANTKALDEVAKKIKEMESSFEKRVVSRAEIVSVRFKLDNKAIHDKGMPEGILMFEVPISKTIPPDAVQQIGVSLDYTVDRNLSPNSSGQDDASKKEASDARKVQLATWLMCRGWLVGEGKMIVEIAAENEDIQLLRRWLDAGRILLGEALLHVDPGAGRGA